MDVILSVLGQDKRLDILRALLEAETGCGVTSLSKTLSIKAPTVEKHLSTLRKIGLVKKQMTLDFARERWMIRGHKRVVKLLELLDAEVRELVEVGHVFEEVEKAVRRQQYYKEQAASVQEIENARKEGEYLDMLLQKLGKQYVRILDEDELKKVNYWINARSLGVL
jgi:DNA-binding IclR family transcriptional regulator